jgi:microcystin-dependent protein
MGTYEANKYSYTAANLSNVPGVETGTIVSWSHATIPSGFLECNGATISRSTYAGLFSVIGTTYGAGDGSSTFLLPDLQDKVCVGASSGKSYSSTGGAETVATGDKTLAESEIPAHTHSAGTAGGSKGHPNNHWNASPTGASGTSGSTGGDGAHNHGNVSVLQPYIALKYMIKT